jgi:hypothetical protein
MIDIISNNEGGLSIREKLNNVIESVNEFDNLFPVNLATDTTGFLSWSAIDVTPTTLSGYGITDAVRVENVFNIGNIGGAVTLNRLNGRIQKASLTNTTTLNAPSNGSEGVQLKLYLTASGANRNLTLHSDIRIPSDSTFTSPKTLESGKMYILQMEHNGSFWALTTLVGGYN